MKETEKGKQFYTTLGDKVVNEGKLILYTIGKPEEADIDALTLVHLPHNF